MPNEEPNEYLKYAESKNNQAKLAALQRKYRDENEGRAGPGENTTEQMRNLMIRMEE